MIYMPLVEEPGLLKRFGDEFEEYKKNVPRWLPRVLSQRGRKKSRESLSEPEWFCVNWLPQRQASESTPGKIRTCDLRIRNALLYPAELRGHGIAPGGSKTDHRYYPDQRSSFKERSPSEAVHSMVAADASNSSRQSGQGFGH
jgi:hypothetical protein